MTEERTNAFWGFFKEYWIPFTSFLAGGIAGFFSAWVSVELRISELALEVRELKTVIESSIKPNINKIEGVSAQSKVLRDEVNRLNESKRFLDFVQDRIQRDLNEARVDTIRELKELIKDVKQSQLSKQ